MTVSLTDIKGHYVICHFDPVLKGKWLSSCAVKSKKGALSKPMSLQKHPCTFNIQVFEGRFVFSRPSQWRTWLNHQFSKRGVVIDTPLLGWLSNFSARWLFLGSFDTAFCTVGATIQPWQQNGRCCLWRNKGPFTHDTVRFSGFAPH